MLNQQNHEKLGEAAGKAVETAKEDEKGKKSPPFKINRSPPKGVDGQKTEKEKEKEKRSPTTKVKDLVQRELIEKTGEKDKQKGKGKKNPTSKVPKSSAQVEVEALREEVCSLKQQLQENEKETEELKSQKTQQICALTFKLANAMRQREKAEEQLKVLKEDMEELKEQLRQVKRKADTTNLDAPSPDISRERNGKKDGLNEEVSDLDSVNSDDTAILCTSINLLQLEKEVESAEKRAAEVELKELPLSNVSGLQSQPDTLNKLANPTLSCPGSEASEGKDVNREFTEIQKELRNVRDSMSLMQGLNQQLSEDLQQFSEFQKSLLTGRKKAKSPSRRRKLGTRHAGSKHKVQGSGSSSSSTSSSPDPSEEEREQEGVLTRYPDLLHGSTLSLTERPMYDESPSKTDKEVQVTRDNEVNKRAAGACYEDEIRRAEERAKQLEDEDEGLRQQLKRVITNMETLKADNKEMKQELKKLSSPVKADSELLIKTTLFTDKLLREMKERDLQVRQNLRRVDGFTCKELAQCEKTEGVTQKNTSANLTDQVQVLPISPERLLKKERNVLNHSAKSLAGSPGRGTVGTCSPKPSVLSESITPHKFETAKANSAFETKRNSNIPESHVISDNEEKSPTRKLQSSLEIEDEIDSAPDQFRRFLDDTMDLGIQRYVVRSSETIANLRDLKPEELAYY